MIILQKLKHRPKNALQLAEWYFGIMSITNGLELAKREIQLMAFTAVRGNIGSATSKKEFVDVYESSLATVGNILSKLTNSGLLVKHPKKVISVHKALALDFEKNLKLEITFENVSEQA